MDIGKLKWWSKPENMKNTQYGMYGFFQMPNCLILKKMRSNVLRSLFWGVASQITSACQTWRWEGMAMGSLATGKGERLCHPKHISTTRSWRKCCIQFVSNLEVWVGTKTRNAWIVWLAWTWCFPNKPRMFTKKDCLSLSAVPSFPQFGEQRLYWVIAHLANFLWQRSFWVIANPRDYL